MRWKVCLTGAIFLTALVAVLWVVQLHEIKFTKLEQAKARLAAKGYHCTSDSANGTVGGGFMISRTALHWNDVGMVCKSGPMGPEWEGKVWVTLNPDSWQLEAVPDQAGVRVWGSVVAFGDEAFLHEIEAAL